VLPPHNSWFGWSVLDLESTRHFDGEFEVVGELVGVRATWGPRNHAFEQEGRGVEDELIVHPDFERDGLGPLERHDHGLAVLGLEPVPVLAHDRADLAEPVGRYLGERHAVRDVGRVDCYELNLGGLGDDVTAVNLAAVVLLRNDGN